MNWEILLLTVRKSILYKKSTASTYLFEMPRFIDGIDLVGMTLVIHFVNPEGLSDHVKPVNVSFSEDKIQFAWLVDEKVTAIAG